MKTIFVQGSLIKKAHELLSSRIQEGDTVVDATLGNGHDTLFLAKCVGEQGRVIGFDIQQEALIATKQRLIAAGIREQAYELHRTGHDLMVSCVPGRASVIMFNLGYLPGGDKRIITSTETTITALNQSLGILESGGLLSVMCYPGHSGGDSEADAVVKWAADLGQIMRVPNIYRRDGSDGTSPFLILAEKL